MAKQIKTSKPTNIGKKSSLNTLFGIPEKYQDYVLIGVLILLVYIFLGGAIFGNGLEANSDRMASDSFKNYLSDANKTGEFPQWIPYIFGGMPAYGSLLITGDRWWDFFTKILHGFTGLIGDVSGNDTGRVAAFYALYAIGVFLLLRYKKIDRISSFLGGFAATFSTSVIVWVIIGHNTKPVAAACLPFILLFWEKLKHKFSFIDFVLLAIATHFLFESTHVQMIFYIAVALGIYFIFDLVSGIISKINTSGVYRAAGLMLLSAGLAFLLSSDRYLSVMEYTPYSTRGSAPIKISEAHSNNVVSDDGGNPYDYATMWSFSPQEISTFFVPNFYGFGQLKYDPRAPENSGTLLSQFFQEETKLPTYFSQKPMEDAAPYMGVVVLFLAIFGAVVNFRNIFVKFLVFLSFFSILLAFGYTFPIVYDIFYYYVPSFNKFRAPSMALFLVQFAVPILAAYGLHYLFKSKEESNEKAEVNNKQIIHTTKILSYFLYTSIVFLVIGVLFVVMFKDSYFSAIASSKIIGMFPEQNRGQVLPELQEFIWSNMISDWFINASLLIIAFGLLYFYLKDKVSFTLTSSLIVVIIVFDLWRVGQRPIKLASHKVEYAQVFRETDVVDFLHQDKGLYRVVDLASPSPNMSAFYRLQNVNGYHSAKMRVYQDLLDVTSNGSTSQMTDPFIWNLMNVKYIIYNQEIPGYEAVFKSSENGQVVSKNHYELPRAFFVKKVEVKSKEEIIKKMKFSPEGNFSPTEIAYVEKSLPSSLDSNIENNTVKITKYENQKIELNVTANGNNLLFLSEIYYPAGWKAFIDGKETEIIKTNYAFRSVIVPSGKHVVSFVFDSPKFELGKKLSLTTNVLLVLLLGVGMFLGYRSKNNTENIE